MEDVPTAQLAAAPPTEVTADIEPLVPDVASVAKPSAATAPRPPLEPAKVELDASRLPSNASNPTAQPAAQRAAEPPTISAESPPAVTPREIATGTLLCGRYLLGRLLGAGGSSLIYQAEDRRRIGAEDFGNRIAIKVLRQDMRNNPHAVTRLRREFRQMQRLSHAGIARVFELATEGDVWFMTMELVEGQTILQWLKTGPSRSAALKVISACSEALSHAHETGIVHGDLKPSNVLVLPSGGVKLFDFGSAAERDVATGAVDKERSFAATPPYASPQVLAGEVADPRDDVFSLACLAYAILSQGEHPFERKSSADAQLAHMRPAYARGIYPREFAVIVRGLAWEREQRPASVREFLHAIVASDLRREGATTDTRSGSIDVATQTIAPSPSVPITPSPPPTASPSPTPPASPPLKDAKARNVKPEDVVRLKAALSAAEAHAERVEQAATPKEATLDPLARFKGYVAGPHAPAVAKEESTPSVADQVATAPARSKRIWPWQRSAMIGLLVAGIAAALLTAQLQTESDPERTRATQIEQPAATETEPIAPPTIVQTQPPPEQVLPAQEKKSAPAAVKPPPAATALGEISFTTRTLEVGANQTIAALSLKRLHSTRGRARVTWTIEGGTAKRGVHYQLDDPQVVEFLDGQQVRSLFISLIPEKNIEAARHSKTFTVKLQQSAGGPALGEIKQVYVTIVGDVTDANEGAALAGDSSGSNAS